MKKKTTMMERLRNRYRLIIMNDDTLEEVTAIKLTRLGVYIAMCTMFLVFVMLTVVLIVYTPLKYYIPGYGSRTDREQLIQLKIRADSLESSIEDNQEYWNDVKSVLAGDVEGKLDTTRLEVPAQEKIQD